MGDMMLNWYRVEVDEFSRRHGLGGSSSCTMAMVADASRRVRQSWESRPWTGGAAGGHENRVTQIAQDLTRWAREFEEAMAQMMSMEPEIVHQSDWRSVFEHPAQRMG